MFEIDQTNWQKESILGVLNLLGKQEAPVDK